MNANGNNEGEQLVTALTMIADDLRLVVSAMLVIIALLGLLVGIEIVGLFA